MFLLLLWWLFFFSVLYVLSLFSFIKIHFCVFANVHKNKHTANKTNFLELVYLSIAIVIELNRKTKTVPSTLFQFLFEAISIYFQLILSPQLYIKHTIAFLLIFSLHIFNLLLISVNTKKKSFIFTHIH